MILTATYGHLPKGRENPVHRQKEAPTLEKADKLLDDYVARSLRTMDANNILYSVESSRDYDPGPGLEKIRAPLLAINFADERIAQYGESGPQARPYERCVQRSRDLPGRQHEPEPVAFRRADEIVASVAARTRLKSIGAPGTGQETVDGW